ncbi:MAG TPA: hypothetical protein VK157_04520 [Phycisphaerales bacterium]|nr:hypothetical protein [Phycisphaerales bacterium]
MGLLATKLFGQSRWVMVVGACAVGVLAGCSSSREYNPAEQSVSIKEVRQFSPSQVDAKWPENNAVGPRNVGGGIAIRKHDGKPDGRPDGRRQGRNDR